MYIKIASADTGCASVHSWGLSLADFIACNVLCYPCYNVRRIRRNTYEIRDNATQAARFTVSEISRAEYLAGGSQ